MCLELKANTYYFGILRGDKDRNLMGFRGLLVDFVALMEIGSLRAGDPSQIEKVQIFV